MNGLALKADRQTVSLIKTFYGWKLERYYRDKPEFEDIETGLYKVHRNKEDKWLDSLLKQYYVKSVKKISGDEEHYNGVPHESVRYYLGLFSENIRNRVKILQLERQLNDLKENLKSYTQISDRDLLINEAIREIKVDKNQCYSECQGKCNCCTVYLEILDFMIDGIEKAGIRFKNVRVRHEFDDGFFKYHVIKERDIDAVTIAVKPWIHDKRKEYTEKYEHEIRSIERKISSLQLNIIINEDFIGAEEEKDFNTI